MKFLVVDDHSLIRDAMRGVLDDVESDAVVLTANSAAEAKETLERNTDISLVLLDLRLPDRDGIDMLSEVRERWPAVAVVMMSGFTDRDNVMRALEAGALGFIPKTDTRDVLVSALRLVLAGGVYIPPDILGRAPAISDVLQPVAPPVEEISPTLDASVSRPSSAALRLTERQFEVLALMMKGKSNKLICRELDLAEPTVKNHVSAILKALGVSNRTEAVLAAARFEWQVPRQDE